MGAAAVALRLPLLRARQLEAPPTGLSFNGRGGPLVAVCGLVGGSGASTLALALAAEVARASRSPVLLTESAPELASLAALAQRASPLSLSELASHVQTQSTPAHVFVEIEPGLRLLASHPRRDPCPTSEALTDLLDQAREVHGLVIVDCGTAWPTSGAVLSRATHIIWTLPATASALARTEALWTGPLAPPPGRWHEALVVTPRAPSPTVSVRHLRHLAARRCQRLVMSPFERQLASGGVAPAALVRTLAALATFLRTEHR